MALRDIKASKGGLWILNKNMHHNANIFRKLSKFLNNPVGSFSVGAW